MLGVLGGADRAGVDHRLDWALGVDGGQVGKRRWLVIEADVVIALGHITDQYLARWLCGIVQ